MNYRYPRIRFSVTSQRKSCLCPKWALRVKNMQIEQTEVMITTNKKTVAGHSPTYE